MTVTFAEPDAAFVLSRAMGDAVRGWMADRPRSRQRKIGPSQIGHPCLRRVAFTALGMESETEGAAAAQQPGAAGGGDPWAPFVGTWVHEGLAEAFRWANRALGRERWLVEHPVTVSGSITGTLDLYDIDTATVIDHKVVGPSTMARVRAGGPGVQYSTQGQLYGLGLINQGRPVEHVAVVFWPRSGNLNGRIPWREPFDPAAAESALNRLAGAISLAGVLDVDTHPDRWTHIPAEPGPGCSFCPFWAPSGTASDGTYGRCPGAVS